MSERGRRGAILTVVVIGLVAAACAGRADPSSAPSKATAATTTATTSPRVTPTPPGASASAPNGSAPLVVDPALLAVLPAQIAGVTMLPAPETAAGMITDSALGRSASGIAVGMVVAPGSSGNDDLAISTVVQLRPGINGDTFFDDWRAAYDVSACEPAGGVASHVQQLIGPHRVEVTVCGGGARLYHTRLSGDRLVSITAVGDRKFGDLIMAGLRE